MRYSMEKMKRSKINGVGRSRFNVNALLASRFHGNCISCGRSVPWPHTHDCPFCSEAVLMPRLWAVLRKIWLVAFAGAWGFLLLQLLFSCGSLQVRLGLSLPQWILWSLAALFFLLPMPAQDVIVSSAREELGWQLKSLLGSVMIGLAALSCAISFYMGLSDCLGALVCVILCGCLFTSPLFFRLSAERIWAGLFFVLCMCLSFNF